MTDFVYRFRSIDKLLASRHELENQEIYFSPPEDLNDPMEGFKDILWLGSQIVWSNLFKHYLLFLMQTVLVAYVCGPSREFTDSDSYVFQTEESMPTPKMRGIYQDICKSFFQQEDIARFLELLSARESPVRRNELISYLRCLHIHALNTVLTTIENHGVIAPRPTNDSLRAASRGPLLCRNLLEGLQALEREHPERPEIVEIMSAAAKSILMQVDIIHDYSGISLKAGAAWRTIISAFPERHVAQLEKLLYGNWYTACFVGDPTHAAMWGIYGNGHRGVCLKFKTPTDALGKPSIKLRMIIGGQADTSGSRPIYGDVNLQFYKIEYQNKFAKIDFFRSLGRLPMRELKYWYMDAEGNISRCGKDILTENNAWREKYWNDFITLMTTKLPDWAHENEYRLTLHGLITDFAEPSSRTLKYLFEDLQGIIFGMKTSTADKLDVLRIIESKCRKEGRADFELHQAYYSPRTGKIETTKLDMLKFSGVPSA
jgi:hypothetical protein